MTAPIHFAHVEKVEADVEKDPYTIELRETRLGE
jgi:hypothetical protein